MLRTTARTTATRAARSPSLPIASCTSRVLPSRHELGRRRYSDRKDNAGLGLKTSSRTSTSSNVQQHQQPDYYSSVYTRHLRRLEFPTDAKCTELWQNGVRHFRRSTFSWARLASPRGRPELAVDLLSLPGPARYIPGERFPPSNHFNALLHQLRAAHDAAQSGSSQSNTASGASNPLTPARAVSVARLGCEYADNPFILAQLFDLLTHVELVSDVQNAFDDLKAVVREHTSDWVNVRLRAVEAGFVNRLLCRLRGNEGSGKLFFTADDLDSWRAVAPGAGETPSSYLMPLTRSMWESGSPWDGLWSAIEKKLQQEGDKKTQMNTWQTLAREKGLPSVAVDLLFVPGPTQYIPGERFPPQIAMFDLLRSYVPSSAQRGLPLARLALKEYIHPFAIARALNIIAVLPSTGATPEVWEEAQARVLELKDHWKSKSRKEMAPRMVFSILDDTERLQPGGESSLRLSKAASDAFRFAYGLLSKQDWRQRLFRTVQAQRKHLLTPGAILTRIKPALRAASYDPISTVFLLQAMSNLPPSEQEQLPDPALALIDTQGPDTDKWRIDRARYGNDDLWAEARRLVDEDLRPFLANEHPLFEAYFARAAKEADMSSRGVL